jgi:hypothetical protein
LFQGGTVCYNKGRQKPPLTIVEKAACRFFEENSLRFVPCHPQGGCDIAPSRHYDSRALSGAPIVPFPRKRLAVSVTDGASPFSAPRKVFSARR